jgi:hypothetical protein
MNWTQSEDFDYECSGARMLGYDMRRLLDDEGRKKVGEILCEQLDAGRLLQEMDRRSPESSRHLLQWVVTGLDWTCS